ncbi:hypothetical protein SDC9_137930 [bioreactor metagenome]|uniref:Uncharacterized protein n=1 Tax=bioreactor metagenome TaxID=1076179 RepID=A0A645DNY0_9ZZZZ
MWILIAHFPRFPILESLVADGGERKDLPEAISLLRALHQRLYLCFLGPDLSMQLLIDRGGQQSIVWVEALDECQGAIDQVRKIADQLAIHFLLEICPGESDIALLRAIVEHVEAPDVGRNTGILDIISKDPDA